jgi:hypothetical protein
MLISTFPDGSYLEFDKGSFDAWCVYLKPVGLPRYAPKDVDYFVELAHIAAKHGRQKVYNDFVTIFDSTSKSIDSAVLHHITRRSATYSPDHVAVNKLFTILYAGMVAEENKANTKLGKRIKRLGVHQVLIDQMKPEAAAVFSRGMKWQQVLREYRQRIGKE